MDDQPTAPETRMLLALLQEGYQAESWHGPNLVDSLKEVGVGQASWRPADGQRNIWEITVHSAYWKYRVLHALKPETPHFRYKGKDWFKRPSPAHSAESETDWESDKALLTEIQSDLIEAVAALKSEDMDRKLSKGVTMQWLVRGAAMHDVYHAGQILSLRQWYEAKKP